MRHRGGLGQVEPPTAYLSLAYDPDPYRGIWVGTTYADFLAGVSNGAGNGAPAPIPATEPAWSASVPGIVGVGLAAAALYVLLDRSM